MGASPLQLAVQALPTVDIVTLPGFTFIVS